MSSGIALVRFGDGTVKVGNYHGTSHLLVPRLFDTAMEATNAYFEGRDGWSDPDGDVEDVVVYVDYGDSFWSRRRRPGPRCCPSIATRSTRAPSEWAGVIQAACSSRFTTASRTGRPSGSVAD